MTLDVIIPAYNCHETLNRALASCAMQKLDPEDSFRVIIVNDASTRGYEDFAEYWANIMDIRLVNKKNNAGCGQARQTGMDVSDADYFMFLDADDALGSPFALRVLMRQMKENHYHMAMGMFVEENEEGTYTDHGLNYIWCHGKIYDRKFIVENNLRFNLTRGNEDVGFHSVLHQLTDNVGYVPQVVYIWEHQQNSLVRNENDGYAFDYGWRDFIENMAWAVEEMQSRDVKEKDILEFVCIVLARLYWQAEEAHRYFPQHDIQNIKCLKDFYRRAVQKYVQNGSLELGRIYKAYVILTNESSYQVIPHQTFDKFLARIGLTKDLKRSET